jgi:hypothetical protein
MVGLQQNLLFKLSTKVVSTAAPNVDLDNLLVTPNPTKDFVTFTSIGKEALPIIQLNIINNLGNKIISKFYKYKFTKL